MTTFHCVDDGVPAESVELLQAACETRGIAWAPHDPRQFLFAPELRAEPGDLLFRPAVSIAAQRVEQHLFRDGVATFHRDPLGPLAGGGNQQLRMERAGVPLPRMVPLLSADRTGLDYYVEQFGGYPVVLKVAGSSGGIGVMKLDSAESLYSVADYMVHSGALPQLMTYIDDAEHWRCVVVGARVVAAYLNPREGSDFRTCGSEDPDDFTTEVDADMETIAVLATHACGHDLGGVDVLRHASGRCYVLESNFPCYYAHAQVYGGIDVAGAMVDLLLEKARAGGSV